MAKRMTNKARIQQRAEEAAAADKEKTEKKKTVKKTTAKKKTVKKKAGGRRKADAASARQKVVWKVFNANYKEVACYPYPEKKKAYAEMEKLMKKSGNKHFVNAVKVPMEDE